MAAPCSDLCLSYLGKDSILNRINNFITRLTRIMNISLVPQTPIREEKGSGNIVYNELCQTQECGATNQIASFVISVTSHNFAHIIYRANLQYARDVGNNY